MNNILSVNEGDMLEKILDRIDQYLVRYGYLLDGKFRYPTSETMFQSDNMQTDALEMVGDLLDIISGKS